MCQKTFERSNRLQIKLRNCYGGSARRIFWHLLIESVFNYIKTKIEVSKKKDRTDISKLCDKKERMTQWLEISILMN